MIIRNIDKVTGVQKYQADLIPSNGSEDSHVRRSMSVPLQCDICFFQTTEIIHLNFISV